MVDQEGGRVARLRPPYWLAHPSAAAMVRCLRAIRGRIRAAWLTGALIGLDAPSRFRPWSAAPVLDLRLARGHDVIGDRAFAGDPPPWRGSGRRDGGGIAGRRRAAGRQARAGPRPRPGGQPSGLPVVDEPTRGRFSPFAANADLPWMMTAHSVYDALDPVRPATLSPASSHVVRGRIGFGGVLVSDDLAMKALDGTPAERAWARWPPAATSRCIAAASRPTRRLAAPAARSHADAAARLGRREPLAAARRGRWTARHWRRNGRGLLREPNGLAVGALVGRRWCSAIILHEAAHGYAALALGDDTRDKPGRLSLNPLRACRPGRHHHPARHFLVVQAVAHIGGGRVLFGWAKPVPIAAVAIPPTRGGA